ncbi:MAG: 1-acyl-sn-glycerol-3-phosphate acyltransferase [Candidatus Nealsonbacteria bacterium]|nr:1-acyl-sn-glycerol-3-phosphate acyltransferase [Candidatus Nealsonbacteria bacterium]
MLLAVATDTLAICTFGAIGLALIAWVVIRLRRGLFTPVQALFFMLIYLLVRLLWRAELPGRLPVDRGQGAIIVCNHRSPADPAFIAATTGRLVHWMVAREFATHWLFGRILGIAEVISTNRGGIDTASTKQAIRLAAEGDLVGIFPEGRINISDAVLMPGRPGAAMIALRARVPIVPCYIEGAPYDGTPVGCLLMKAKVRLQYGEPIDISEYYGREREREVLEEITRRLLAEIAKLAGCHDFQPQLAGRSYKPAE